MVNSGFAPVYNMKNAYLIFRSIKNGNVYKKKLALDVRKVIPKVVFDLKESVDLTGIPAGQYELLLKIEDSSEKLADNADYSIRLANESIWEKETGFNKLLHEVTIQ
jgi:hypothetical protein